MMKTVYILEQLNLFDGLFFAIVCNHLYELSIDYYISLHIYSII